MKQLTKSIIRKLPLNIELQEKVLFMGKVGYWPNFKHPRTLNEKVNWRKLYSTNEAYITCSDKLAVRDYVAERVGDDILIPILYSAPSITAQQILDLGNDIVVKTNHDCGSVFMIHENTHETASDVCEKIGRSLKMDFGKDSNQWWYSEIPPMVYVEKMLKGKNGHPPEDFKFTLFRHESPESPRGFIKIDSDRGQSSRTRSFYSLDRETLPWIYQSAESRPFPEIKNYEEMLQIAKTLASDFDYVRVDLYNVEGKTYFGELTFSQSGGRFRYTRQADKTLGSWWNLDTSKGGSERPS